MRKDVPTCLAQGMEDACAITRADFDAKAQPIGSAPPRAARRRAMDGRCTGMRTT
jgi:hypothetical protein